MKYSFSRKALLLAGLILGATAAIAQQTNLASAGDVRGVLNANNGGTGVNTVGVSGCPLLTNGVWSFSSTNCTATRPAGATQAIQLNLNGVFAGSAALIDLAGNIFAPAGTTATLPSITSTTIATTTFTALTHSTLVSAQVAGSMSAAVAALPSAGGDIVAEHDSAIHNMSNVNGLFFGNSLPAKSIFWDFNGGTFGIESVSPAFTPSRNGYYHVPLTFLDYTYVDANAVYGPSQGMDAYCENTLPGYSLGNNGVGPTQGWYHNGCFAVNAVSHNAGIADGLGILCQKFGTGDINCLRMYDGSRGGATAASDESATVFAPYYNELQPWFGNVAVSAAAGTATVLANCTTPSAQCNNLGARQVLLDETTGVVTGTQTLLSIGTMGTAQSNQYAILTTSYAVPVSTATGTVSAECDIPAPPSSAQVVTCTLALSSQPQPGDLITLAGSETETARVTSVTATNTSGVYSVTLPLTYSHEAGSVACANGISGRYFEQPEFTYTRDGNVHRYVAKGICSPSANTVWVAWQLFGTSTGQFWQTGASTMYWGVDTLDVRRSDGTVYTQNGNTSPQQLVTTVLPVTFAAGDVLEQTNNIANGVNSIKVANTIYNPYLSFSAALNIYGNGPMFGGLPASAQNGGGIVNITNNESFQSYTFNCALLAIQGNTSPCTPGLWTPLPTMEVGGTNGGGVLFANAPERSNNVLGQIGDEPTFLGVNYGQNSIGHYNALCLSRGRCANYSYVPDTLTWEPRQVFSSGFTTTAPPGGGVFSADTNGNAFANSILVTGAGGPTNAVQVTSTGANNYSLFRFTTSDNVNVDFGKNGPGNQGGSVFLYTAAAVPFVFTNAGGSFQLSATGVFTVNGAAVCTVGSSTCTSSLTSVFGRTGAVVAAIGDYTVSQVTGAAPLASPALSGVPTAPTAPLSTNGTQIATTAFVQAILGNLTGTDNQNQLLAANGSGGFAVTGCSYTTGTESGVECSNFITTAAGAPGYHENLYTPSSSSGVCVAGDFADDAGYHYVCVATNTWKRVALSPF